MEQFIINHWKLIAIIIVMLLWLTFCLECYCDKRDGIKSIETDVIDGGV